MKSLVSKEFLLGSEKCFSKLFLDDIYPCGAKKGLEYVFRAKVSKNVNLNDESMFETFLSNITEMFMDLESDKNAVYIHSDHAVDIYGDGYIDVFYSSKNMHNLDEMYRTDDGRIGKCLLHVEEFDTTEEHRTLAITVQSLIIVNEKNELTSLWKISENSVTKFLKDELLEIMS